MEDKLKLPVEVIVNPESLDTLLQRVKIKQYPLYEKLEVFSDYATADFLNNIYEIKKYQGVNGHDLRGAIENLVNTGTYCIFEGRFDKHSIHIAIDTILFYASGVLGGIFSMHLLYDFALRIIEGFGNARKLDYLPDWTLSEALELCINLCQCHVDFKRTIDIDTWEFLLSVLNEPLDISLEKRYLLLSITDKIHIETERKANFLAAVIIQHSTNDILYRHLRNKYQFSHTLSNILRNTYEYIEKVDPLLPKLKLNKPAYCQNNSLLCHSYKDCWIEDILYFTSDILMDIKLKKEMTTEAIREVSKYVGNACEIYRFLFGRELVRKLWNRKRLHTALVRHFPLIIRNVSILFKVYTSHVAVSEVLVQIHDIIKDFALHHKQVNNRFEDGLSGKPDFEAYIARARSLHVDFGFPEEI